MAPHHERLAELRAALTSIESGETFEAQESLVEKAFGFSFDIDADEVKRRARVGYLVMQAEGVGDEDIIEAIQIVDYHGDRTEIPRKIITPGKIGRVLPKQARDRYDSMNDRERERVSLKYAQALARIARRSRLIKQSMAYQLSTDFAGCDISKFE